MTDTMGNLLDVQVHAANQSDTIMGVRSCIKAFNADPSLKSFSADVGYRGTTYNFVTNELQLMMDIPEKNPNQFTLQKIRWIVDRTLSWLGKFRRLAKDFEKLPEISENIIRIAMIRVTMKAFFN